jgi:hypothetical protein
LETFITSSTSNWISTYTVNKLTQAKKKNIKSMCVLSAANANNPGFWNCETKWRVVRWLATFITSSTSDWISTYTVN